MKQNKIPRNEYIRKPVGKTNPYKEDTIYTDMGQWKYPGQVTKIPSGDITMQGVPYPVYGEDNLGYSQMMYPGMDYQFPGQYVTEYPQMAKNGGGLLNKTLTCPKCGWSWKAVDGGKDITTCHKCGSTAKLAYGGDPSLPNIEGHYPFGGQNSKTGTHFEEGGWLDQAQEGKEYRAKNMAEYNKLNKAHNDSLMMYNEGLKHLALNKVKYPKDDHTYHEYTPKEKAYETERFTKDGTESGEKYNSFKDMTKLWYLDELEEEKKNPNKKNCSTCHQGHKTDYLRGETNIEPVGVSGHTRQYAAPTTKILLPKDRKQIWTPGNQNQYYDTFRIADDLGQYANASTEYIDKKTGLKIDPSKSFTEKGEYIYPKIGKDIVSKKMGGWLDDEEFRRGGQRRRRGTSKNIQSSINDVFERNYDVFGSAGKLRFNPRARYEEGGWLNQYQEAGQLRAASTTAAVPVSTQAPINPVNPESTMGIVDFVKHRWNTRDQRPSDWNMMMMDKTGSYVDSGVDPFTLMLSAPQQVIKTATALKTIKSGTPKSLKVSQAPRKSYQDLTIRDKVINPSKPITSIPEEFQPYISRTNPDFFKLYDKNLSKAEMKKKMLENTTFFDRKGNVISTPENLKKTGGQSGWLDKYNNF